MPSRGRRSQAAKARWIRSRLADTVSIDASSVDTQLPHLEHEDSQTEEREEEKPRRCQRVESVRATHCQSDQRYDEFSRNHQCSCMALTFLAYHSEGWQFDGAFLDKVLEEGDSLYVSVKNQLLSDGSYVHDHLAVEEMPRHILTDRDVYYMHVSSVRCGHLKAEEDGPGDWFPLATHLQCLLTDVSLALLIVSPDCLALFRDRSGRYGVFDSHSRSAAGLPHPDGTAVMLTFTHLSDLINHLHELFRGCGDSASYEFVPISFESVTDSSAELRAESGATEVKVETHNSNTAADVADQTAAIQKRKRQTPENKETRLKRKRLATNEYARNKYARCAEFRIKRLQAAKARNAEARSLRRQKMLLVKNYYADPHVQGHLNGAHHVCRTCYTKTWSE